MATNRIWSNKIRPAIYIKEGKIQYFLENAEDSFPATTQQEINYATQEIARDLAKIAYNGEVIIHGGNKVYCNGVIIEKDTQQREEPIQKIIDAFNNARQKY